MRFPRSSEIFFEDQLVINKGSKDYAGKSNSFYEIDHYRQRLKLVLFRCSKESDHNSYCPYGGCFSDI